MVVPYDSNWPIIFGQLGRTIWPAVSDVATSIEHVGSTSVPGLSAKPIVDLDVVIPTRGLVSLAISRLATLGYIHQGNLGVEGREAFLSPGSAPRHHLYCCVEDCLAYRNHLAVRDHLKANPLLAKRYGDLKIGLVTQHPQDMTTYTRGKTEAILRILEAAGFCREELEMVRSINRRA